MSPLNWISAELEQLQQLGLLRGRREIEPLPQGRCLVDGQPCWNFGSNDYLGLAHDVRLRSAAAQALEQSGTGAQASPLVTGRTVWHARLERDLANFKRSAAAILFPSGFAANVGTISALVGRGDEIYCDRLNHASLVDGARISGAKLRIYPHRDISALERDLARQGNTSRRRLIVTDSLFSMDGDLAPLGALYELARSYDAMLLVDEAHATGVYGQRGAGLVEELGLNADDGALVCVGTLSKAIGAQGGFVTGPQHVIDWLWNSARTQMFSTALTPATCAAASQAVEIIQAEPQGRQRLLALSSAVVQELTSQGWSISSDCQSPIIPVMVGSVERALELSAWLQRRGHFVPAIRPPTVPNGTCRLRISLSLAHAEAGIHQLLADFAHLRTAIPE